MEDIKIKKSSSILMISLILVLTLAACGPERGDFIGVNQLSPEQMNQIDQHVARFSSNYDYINIALIHDREIVLTKTYGQNRLDKLDVYASVSKPVTVMVFLQLLEAGKIQNLQDDIGIYAPRYQDSLPEICTDTPITFENLLTHQSGVPHLSQLWDNNTLLIDFCPGSEVEYSTNAYGILGEVMQEITGKEYEEQVRTFISEPVGATTFKTGTHFTAPGGQVRSTIYDMGLFAVGVLNESYVSNELLDNFMLQKYAQDDYGDICLGWYCQDVGEPNMLLFHAGSNGKPRAFIVIMPNKGNAVGITAMIKSEESPQDLNTLALLLLSTFTEK